MWLRLVLALALGLSLNACANPRTTSASAPAGAEAHDGTWERLPDEHRIGRYVSSGWGFSTVSYWIEGPQGVVLVDTQFLPSAAEELVEIAERQTGKPVVAAVVLHANPDKFNGTATLEARGIEVLTSTQVLALIPEVHEIRTNMFAERYAPDYPAVEPKPKSFGEASTTLHLGGLDLDVHVMGPGCSGAHVALTWEDHLFVGDLVANGSHSWLELGLSDQWLARIDELSALGASHVHPGRGASGGAELLETQAEYLRRVQTLIEAEHAALHEGGRSPSPAEVKQAIARVGQTIEREHPDHRFAVFLSIGLPAEWRRVDALRSGVEPT